MCKMACEGSFAKKPQPMKGGRFRDIGWDNIKEKKKKNTPENDVKSIHYAFRRCSLGPWAILKRQCAGCPTKERTKATVLSAQADDFRCTAARCSNRLHLSSRRACRERNNDADDLKTRQLGSWGGTWESKATAGPFFPMITLPLTSAGDSWWCNYYKSCQLVSPLMH